MALEEVGSPLGKWYFFTILQLLSDTFAFTVSKNGYRLKKCFSFGFEANITWVTPVMLSETQLHEGRYSVETIPIVLGLQLIILTLCRISKYLYVNTCPYLPKSPSTARLPGWPWAR